MFWYALITAAAVLVDAGFRIYDYSQQKKAKKEAKKLAFQQREEEKGYLEETKKIKEKEYKMAEEDLLYQQSRLLKKENEEIKKTKDTLREGGIGGLISTYDLY